TAHVEARKPFSLEPKLPTENTAGDRLDVPVTLTNDTDAPRTVQVAADVQGLKSNSTTGPERVSLAAQQRSRRVYSYQPTIVEGMAELRFVGRGEAGLADSVTHTLPVVPEGFPVVGSASDTLERVARH